MMPFVLQQEGRLRVAVVAFTAAVIAGWSTSSGGDAAGDIMPTRTLEGQGRSLGAEDLLSVKPLSATNNKNAVPIGVGQQQPPPTTTNHQPLSVVVTPRAFPKWNYSLPCFQPESMEEILSSNEDDDLPATQGFLFLKPHKTGSTTCAGVNFRIARNVAKRRNNKTDDDFCDLRWNHVNAASDHYAHRIPSKSFLWSIIRDPSARMVSMFFHFGVSRGRKVKPTDKNFIEYATQHGKDYYMKRLPLLEYSETARNNLTLLANNVISEYDFIGVTERMDESLVALAMLLNLPLSDVLYVSAKVHGGYDPKCNYLVSSFVSPGMREFLESKKWKNRFTKGDRALHRAANASLDLTIDETLGRPAFEQNLKLYQQALDLAKARCNLTLPCNQNGARVHETNCIVADVGCAFDCLDQVASELNLD